MTLLIAFCWNPITWLMDTVVGPMIEVLVEALYPVFEVAVEFMGEIMTVVFADILYDIFCILLSCVSFLNNAFFVFAGVYNIGTMQSNGSYKGDSLLLETLMWQDSLTAAYWLLTFLSALLCMVFTIIMVARSISHTEFDPRKAVGKVLGSCGKTMLIFLMIPLFMLAGANLASIVSGRLVEDLFEQGSTSIDTIIFLTATMEAATDNNGNLSNELNGINASFTDSVRNKYFTGKDNNGSSISYADYYDDDGEQERVAKKDFDFTKIDYLTGFIVSFFMIFILFGAALFAVRRIMEILLLYIAAPFFVATVPLDGGKKFEGWRDMFVAKLVSCYGIIMLMMLYLSAAPIMVSRSLVLSADGLTDSLLKTILLVGGAFAVKNSHSILLGILNPAAAQAAQQSVMGGFGIATMAGMAVGKTIASPFQGGKGKEDGKDGKGGSGGKGSDAAEKTRQASEAWKPAFQGNKFNG